jgi:DNA-binding ferritin-like protein
MDKEHKEEIKELSHKLYELKKQIYGVKKNVRVQFLNGDKYNIKADTMDEAIKQLDKRGWMMANIRYLEIRRRYQKTGDLY